MNQFKRDQRKHERYHQDETLEDPIALQYAIASSPILCAKSMINTKKYSKCLVSARESGQTVSKRPDKMSAKYLSLQNCYSKHDSMVSNHAQKIQGQEHRDRLSRPAFYRTSGECESKPSLVLPIMKNGLKEAVFYSIYETSNIPINLHNHETPQSTSALSIERGIV